MDRHIEEADVLQYTSSEFPRRTRVGVEAWKQTNDDSDLLAEWQRARDAGTSMHVSVFRNPQPEDTPFHVRAFVLEPETSPKNLAKSLALARLIARQLNARYGCKPRAYFSGNASLYLWVDLPPLELATGPEAVSAWANRIDAQIGPLHLDSQLFRRNHLIRLPWTVHDSSGATCRPVSLDSTVVQMRDQKYSAQLYVSESRAIAKEIMAIDAELKAKPKPAYAPTRTGSGWIESLLTTPVTEGRKRLLWKVLAPYVASRGMPKAEALKTLADYFSACDKLERLRPSKSWWRAYIEAQYRNALDNGIRPMSLTTMRTKDAELYNVIMKAKWRQKFGDAGKYESKPEWEGPLIAAKSGVERAGCEGS